MSHRDLHAGFAAPPRDNGIRPFWIWNAPMSPREIQRQIDAMLEQHTYGAYLFPWSGMRPRYLSEEWWAVVEAGVARARERDFAFCFVDEFNWPSGEVRTFDGPGLPSRVLAASDEFRMRSLVPERGVVAGADYVVAGRRDASGELDPASLRQLRPGESANGDVAWSFTLRTAMGLDAGLVDLMNPDAVGVFLDLVYEEYYRRFGDDFGRTIRAAFSDHEGDYGRRMAWTPGLFAAFERAKGYDLVTHLPLLLEDGGARTPTVRCDYFDVVSDLYADSFFGQIGEWCAAHGIHNSGHAWEESLQAAAAFMGDNFRVQRAFDLPGVDSVVSWGHFPRHFMEARSVAHFRGLPLVVENQAAEGGDAYSSLDSIRSTTSTIAAWGGTLFIPGSFRTSDDRSDYPEDWFEQQPWWRFFHHYADYTARLSYLNSLGRHRCDIALYYPIETVWAHGDPVFREDLWDYRPVADHQRGIRVRWDNFADVVERVYDEVVQALPDHQWDLDVIDAHYLGEAELADGRLHLAGESYGVLVLPPMTCMRLASARRVRAFAEAGGLVLAIGRLATDSMENGRNDPELLRELAATPLVLVDDVAALLALLEERVERDVEVLQGDRERLYFLHREIDGRDVYLLVNDTDAAKDVVLRVRAAGRPERWEPETGERRALHHVTRDGRTELHLELGPRQACHVVFGEGPAQPLELVETTLTRATVERDGDVVVVRGEGPLGEAVRALVRDGDATWAGELPTAAVEPVTLGGRWRVTPRPGTVPVAYAPGRVVPAGDGVACGFHLPDHNDAFWATAWLSQERFTIRDWWIAGPWQDGYHIGFVEARPPEAGIDLEATYDGGDGAVVGWRRHRGDERVVDLDAALGLVTERPRDTQRWKTAYAVSYVHVEQETRAQLRVVAASNAKAWLNGELVLRHDDDNTGYLELRDAFGDAGEVVLRPGWNELLLKVSQGLRWNPFCFAARICDADGRPVPGVRYAAVPDEPAPASAPVERWYRLAVPPGTTDVRRRELPAAAELYLDGEPVDGALSAPAGGTLAVRLPGGADVLDFVVFDCGPADTPLGSRSHTPFSWFVGTWVYETAFELGLEHLEHRLLLDLGAVGVTADVHVNEVAVGHRVWRPYVLDVTDAVAAGHNTLRVEVANTRAQERARGPRTVGLHVQPCRGRELLDRLEPNGLLGPVRLVPWVRAELRCEPVPA